MEVFSRGRRASLGSLSDSLSPGGTSLVNMLNGEIIDVEGAIFEEVKTAPCEVDAL